MIQTVEKHYRLLVRVSSSLQSPFLLAARLVEVHGLAAHHTPFPVPGRLAVTGQVINGLAQRARAEKFECG